MLPNKSHSYSPQSWLWWCAMGFWGMGVCFWMACPSGGCKQNSDCTAPQVCSGGQCVVPSEQASTDGGQEKTVDGGQGTEMGAEALGDPPPFPDVVWAEGRLPAPETLGDNQPIPAQGTRQSGETCNPFLTALPQDRCVANQVCAATSSGTTGICIESCDPKGASCKTGTRCVEIFSPDLRISQGHACVGTVPLGFPCSQARTCETNHVCMSYTSATEGICRKACQQKDDCPGQWCYSNKDVTGKDVTGCAPFVEKEDEPCPAQTVCGSGLNCHGSADHRRCLKNCSGNGACPSTHTCNEVKDSAGAVQYSLCFRNAKAGENCDSTTVCEKDHRCVTLASSPHWGRCLRDCTSDSKVCQSGELCDTLSGDTKVCYRVAQEKAACDGEFRCAPGFSCVKTQNLGPKHCLKTCDAQTPCASGQQCLTLHSGNGVPSVCVGACDPKATQPCVDTNTQCIENITTSPVCLPSLAMWLGQLSVNAPCSPHAMVPPNLRCQTPLTCTKLAEGWRCLQTCTSTSPCPQGQQCLQAHLTQQSYCGTAGTAAQPCHVGQSQLCAAGLQCSQQVASSQGLCVPDKPQVRHALCHPQELPCERSDLCSGDPSTPFRWICRAVCQENSPPSCPASQICLPTVDGKGVCVDPCATDNKCSNQKQQCAEIQKKKVCL